MNQLSSSSILLLLSLSVSLPPSLCLTPSPPSSPPHAHSLTFLQEAADQLMIVAMGSIDVIVYTDQTRKSTSAFSVPILSLSLFLCPSQALPLSISVAYSSRELPVWLVSPLATDRARVQ